MHLRIYPLSRDIKDQAQCEAEFANKSRFEKLRSCHYDPAFNFAFLDHIVGGTIPNNFIPAVEKGCKEMLERGVLAGYRIQDCAVEVHFGKYHDVDSSEAAFKTAGRLAFKKAFLAARPSLLEPIVKLEITPLKNPDWTNADKMKLSQDGLFDSASFVRQTPPPAAPTQSRHLDFLQFGSIASALL